MDAGGRATQERLPRSAPGSSNIRRHFTVRSMCRFLQVSQNAYYARLHRAPSSRAREDEQLSPLVKTTFEKSRSTYGTRRLKIALSHQGQALGRCRIGRLMKKAGLVCKPKRHFKITADSQHDSPVAPNHLDRQFSVERVNQVYVGDITYIPTREGWLYLAVVIDLFSRQIVCWSMAEHMKIQLVNDALLMAIWKRKSSKGLLRHTDRAANMPQKAIGLCSNNTAFNKA